MRVATHPRLWLGGVLMLFSIGAMAQNAVTTDVVSVRAGPDSSYPEVAQLDADAPIQVMGCLDDWSWCDVSFADNRGWLYAPDISYQYEGGYVPFYTYAPAFGLPVVAFSIDTYWGSHYHDRPWYAQRDEWIHRTIRHQRPPGPAPSRTAPPREVVRAEKPHAGLHPDESVRLSKAEPTHRDANPSGSGPRAPEHVAPPPPAERNARPDRPATPQRHEGAAENAAPQRHEGAPERAVPQRPEEHAHAAEPAATGHHAEPEARKSEPEPRKSESEPRKSEPPAHKEE
jgi:uncharacterized protein YraI